MDNSRTLPLLSLEQRSAISTGTIVLCGLGGVGGAALEMLVRVGFKSFVLADCDYFESSNINRQILSNTHTFGKSKAEVASVRVSLINPEAKTAIYTNRIGSENAHEVFDKACEVAIGSPLILVDAIDDIPAKVALWKEASNRGAKIITSAGAGRRRDPAKIKTGTLDETTTCPLAKRMRIEAKNAGLDAKTIMTVWSTEKALSCENLTFIPSLATVTNTFGIMLASLALGI